MVTHDIGWRTFKACTVGGAKISQLLVFCKGFNRKTNATTPLLSVWTCGVWRWAAYQLFLSGNAQQVELVEDEEEGVHHAHSPAEQNQHPDNIGPQHMGGVSPEPPIVPRTHPIRSCSTCNIACAYLGFRVLNSFSFTFFVVLQAV